MHHHGQRHPEFHRTAVIRGPEQPSSQALRTQGGRKLTAEAKVSPGPSVASSFPSTTHLPLVYYIVLLKCNRRVTLYSSQVYKVMIQYLYMLQKDVMCSLMTTVNNTVLPTGKLLESKSKIPHHKEKAW